MKNFKDLILSIKFYKDLLEKSTLARADHDHEEFIQLLIENYKEGDALLEYFLSLKKNPLDLGTPEQTESINSKLNSTLTRLSEIKDSILNPIIDYQTLALINSAVAYLISTLKEAKSLTKEEDSTSFNKIGNLIELEKIEQSISLHQKKIDSLEAQQKKLPETIEKYSKETAISVLSEAKDNALIDKTITESAAIHIEKLSKEEKFSSYIWVGAGAICIAAVIIYAIFFMRLNLLDYTIEPKLRNDFSENVQIALLFKDAFKSLFIVSVLASLSFMCFKQYKIHRRNHVLYEHKYFAMNAFSAFMSNSILTDTRNIIVEKAMDAIFKNPDFLDHPTNLNSEKSGDMVQIIKEVLPTHKQ